MKIKSVEYKRLFSLPDYNNETIGIVADVNTEKPEEAIAKLYDVVIKTNKTISKLRKIAVELHHLDSEEYYCNSLPGVEREISRLESRIKEHENKIKNVDVVDELERLQLSKHIDNLNQELTDKKIEYDNLQLKHKRLLKHYQYIKSNFEKGILVEDVLNE